MNASFGAIWNRYASAFAVGAQLNASGNRCCSVSVLLRSGAGNKGSGGKWGWGATGGLAFMLDVLQPRFARDFDSDLGVNHSYLFAEYTYADVNNFGAGGLNLSSRRWMFGLALDY